MHNLNEIWRDMDMCVIESMDGEEQLTKKRR